MANKYTRKSREKAPVGTDEFVSFWQKLYEKVIEPYAQPLVLGIGALVVVLVAWYAIDHFVGKAHAEATEMLGKSLAIYQADLLTDEQAKAQSDKAKGADEEETPRFKTDKERLEATLKALDALDSAHGSSSAARRGQLLRGDALFDLARFDDAGAAYKKYAGGADEGDPLRVLAREGEGLVAEAKGNLDGALATFQDLEKTAGALKDRAMMDQARVLEKKGDKQKAAAVLKDLLAKAPTSPLKDAANARLAALGGT